MSKLQKFKKLTYILIAVCLFAVLHHVGKNRINVQNDLLIDVSDWRLGAIDSRVCPSWDHYDENSAFHRLAVLVPFRDRFTELQEFIPYLENFLNNQKVRHTFFIVNQVDDLRFNRGALLNVGALESVKAEVNGVVVETIVRQNSISRSAVQCLKLPHTNYLALHDVDLLPVDPALKYDIPPEFGPVHLIPHYLHPRYNFFKKYSGGVLIIRRSHYSLVGGMSNSFWGWGHEDDEFRRRIKLNGLKISTPINVTMGIKAFRHIHQEGQHTRDDKTYYSPEVVKLIRRPLGGLTTLNYTVVSRRVITVSGIPAVLINVELYCDSKNCKLKA